MLNRIWQQSTPTQDAGIRPGSFPDHSPHIWTTWMYLAARENSVELRKGDFELGFTNGTVH